jgi:hypothetical protein
VRELRLKERQQPLDLVAQAAVFASVERYVEHG